MLSLLSEVNAAVWEQSCKTIIQKYFDDKLCSGISVCHNNISVCHNNISDAVEQDQSTANQVILSHSTKSHYFFDELGGIYSQNAFLSPFIRTSQKPPQANVKAFFAN